MSTQAEHAKQAKQQNPKPLFAIINGEQIELTDEEYDATIQAWALMRFYQDNPDQQPTQTPFG